MLENIFFGGKLPRFLGFDRGPITLIGDLATPHQGQIYESAGRKTTFAPSYRMVTDLATDEIHTNLAGGPSDRRFSKWYCSDLDNWINGRYKTLRPDAAGEKLPF
jgi:penicillin G amidase